jgi:hypothetical protein
LFYVPLVAFLVSFHVKTGFPLPWDHMLSISSRVNAVTHCICWPNTPTHSHTYLRAYESLAFDWKKKLYPNHV